MKICCICAQKKNQLLQTPTIIKLKKKKKDPACMLTWAFLHSLGFLGS